MDEAPDAHRERLDVAVDQSARRNNAAMDT